MIEQAIISYKKKFRYIVAICISTSVFMVSIIAIALKNSSESKNTNLNVVLSKNDLDQDDIFKKNSDSDFSSKAVNTYFFKDSGTIKTISNKVTRVDQDVIKFTKVNSVFEVNKSPCELYAQGVIYNEKTADIVSEKGKVLILCKNSRSVQSQKIIGNLKNGDFLMQGDAVIRDRSLFLRSDILKIKNYGDEVTAINNVIIDLE